MTAGAFDRIKQSNYLESIDRENRPRGLLQIT